jgi:cysteine-rich repeat protein
MGLHAWVCCAVGAGIGLALACGRGDAFACSSDAQCVQGSQIGTCEATGYCSFPDGTCDSGHRYGDLAGEGLAGTCVVELDTEAGTTGSEGPDPPTSGPTASSPSGPTASSESSARATESSTGSPPDPFCGDGRRDPGEACDDGDDEEGDGCNPDCIASGTALCTDLPGIDLLLSSYAMGVAYVGDEFVITGWEETENTGENVVVRRYGSTCRAAWTVSYDDDGSDGRGLAVAVDPVVETIWIAGSQTTDVLMLSTSGRLVARFDGAGEFVGSDVRVIGAAHGVTVGADGGAVVVGTAGATFDTAAMWVASYDADGSFVEERTAESDEVDRARAVVLAPDLTVFVAGSRGSNVASLADLVIDTVDANGFAELVRLAPEAGVADAQAIVLGSGGDLFVGGYLQTMVDMTRLPSSPRDAYLARYTQAGTLVWSDLYGSPATEYSDEIEAIAIAANDDVIVAGFLNAGLVGAADVWVRRYTADGDMRWETTFDHDGGEDIARGIAIGPSGELAVVGEVQVGDDKNAWIAVLAP